jgi:rapamycin-insensitive companion of mTOR
VTAIKDWRRWNWRMISWMLDGPLCNPANLADVLKTKFMSRVGKLFVLRPRNTNTTSYVWGTPCL